MAPLNVPLKRGHPKASVNSSSCKSLKSRAKDIAFGSLTTSGQAKLVISTLPPKITSRTGWWKINVLFDREMALVIGSNEREPKRPPRIERIPGGVRFTRVGYCGCLPLRGRIRAGGV